MAKSDKCRRAARDFVRGMRKVFSNLDDNSADLATEIERMADELENVEDPLQIINLSDEIDDVISKLEL